MVEITFYKGPMKNRKYRKVNVGSIFCRLLRSFFLRIRILIFDVFNVMRDKVSLFSTTYRNVSVVFHGLIPLSARLLVT